MALEWTKLTIVGALPTVEISNVVWLSNGKYLLCVAAQSPYFFIYERDGLTLTRLDSAVQFTGTGPLPTATGGNLANRTRESGAVLDWSGNAATFAREYVVDEDNGILDRPAVGGDWSLSSAAPSPAGYVDRAASRPSVSGPLVDGFPSIMMRNTSVSPYFQMFKRYPATLRWQYVGLTFDVVPSGTPNFISVSPTGEHIFSVLANGSGASYSCYKVNWTGDLTASLTRIYREASSVPPPPVMTGVDWHPSGKYFAWAGAGSSTTYSVIVKKIAADGNSFLEMAALPGVATGVNNGYDVKWSPDGKFLVASIDSAPKNLRMWSFDEATETFTAIDLIKTGEGPGEGPRVVNYSDDGTLVAVGAASAPRLSVYAVGNVIENSYAAYQTSLRLGQDRLAFNYQPYSAAIEAALPIAAEIDTSYAAYATSVRAFSFELEFPDQIPTQFYGGYLIASAQPLALDEEEVPLLIADFTYQAYSAALDLDYIENATIEFSYGAYSMLILSNTDAEIDTSYAAYRTDIDFGAPTLEGDIGLGYASYSALIDGAAQIGYYGLFAYQAYSSAIEGDAELGVQIAFGYSPYSAELEALVSNRVTIAYSYAAYQVAVEAEVLPYVQIAASYAAYTVELVASPSSSISFTYGPYSASLEGSAGNGLRMAYTYGAYATALSADVAKKVDIRTGYAAYATSIEVEQEATSVLTFFIVQA